MFHLFGFEVRVRAGFMVFLALIVFLYQNAFGLWLAGALAVFTLLHELGHAVAARSAGAEASISLDFLAGYTSFRPRPGQVITAPQHVLITAAGPLVQISVSLGVLALMGVNPASIDSATRTDASLAIWWAGPVIGALNLIPVLPLDGGHLVLTGLETVLGERATRVMVIASLTITGGAAVFLFGTGRGGFAIFIVFLLFNQFQMLQMTSKKSGTPAPIKRLADAESVAWQTGQPGMLEPGQRLSPWFQAHCAIARGDDDAAATLILDDLRSESTRWSAPIAASPHQLQAIVDVLPAELPAGNAYSSQVLADIMLATGQPQRAGEFAVASYTKHRNSPLATLVARSAASIGENKIALQWLGAAADATQDEPTPYAGILGNVMDRAPEMTNLRTTDEFRQIRAALP